MDHEEIIIEILNEEYKIKCSPDEVDLLRKSASQLNDKMIEIKDGSPNISKEKIAVLAGLNIVSDLLKQENRLEELDEASSEIEQLQNYIDSKESFL